jgi:hypothetical protein
MKETEIISIDVQGTAPMILDGCSEIVRTIERIQADEHF